MWLFIVMYKMYVLSNDAKVQVFPLLECNFGIIVYLEFIYFFNSAIMEFRILKYGNII